MLYTGSCQNPLKGVVLCNAGPSTGRVPNQNKSAPQQWENKAHVLKTKHMFTIHLGREKLYLISS